MIFPTTFPLFTFKAEITQYLAIILEIYPVCSKFKKIIRLFFLLSLVFTNILIILSNLAIAEA